MKTKILADFQICVGVPLKYSTFFLVNDTVILIVVFHKALTLRGAGQPT